MQSEAGQQDRETVADARLFVFDVGGVFIGLDPDRRRQILSSASIAPLSDECGKALASLNKSFRLGLIDEDVYLAQAAGIQGVTPDDLRRAETAFLVAGDPSMMAHVRELRGRHRVVAFSNTNALHWRHVTEQLLEPDLFHHAYVSHEMGLEKPDIGAYRMLAAREGIDPARIVFIYDTASNIEAAHRAGWGCCIHHVNTGETIRAIDAALRGQDLPPAARPPAAPDGR